MKLKHLLTVDSISDARFATLEIGGVSADSRTVQPGDLFVAMTGAKDDGLRFVAQALAAGAAAVMAERVPQTPLPPNVAFVKVHDVPRQIWAALGCEAASIGTIGLVSGKREVYGSLTTPDPVALHRELDALAKEGVTHLALEASSHGLDQHRLDGVRIAAGGFTNISRDHLDYHPSMSDYLAAKLRLFTDLVEPGGAAVI